MTEYQIAAQSPGRARYQTIGLVLGPILSLLVLLWPVPEGLTTSAWHVVALMALMGCWWATEAIPVPATSLIPLVWLPIFGVTSAADASEPFASPVIFLLLGGFIMAMGLQHWDLHRRLALIILLRFADHPQRLIGGFMVAAAVLSMWISNTATTLMLLPIAMQISAHVLDPKRDAAGHPFAIALFLGIAYAASIGGLGTIIGTPPNAFVVGFIRQTEGYEISFLEWMAYGVPVVMVMVPAAWFVLTRLVFRFAPSEVDGARDLIARELAEMGPLSVPERRISIIFACTATAWMLLLPLRGLTGLSGLSNMVIAIAGGLSMFLVPAGGGAERGTALLTWDQAVKLPWGVVLMFGGGLSLAAAIQSTGLAEWLGDGLSVVAALHPLLIMGTVVLLVIFLTEITSNTATVAALVPILGALAGAADIDPIILAAPVAMAGSCAFMLPVATGPNAVVFSTGRVTVPQMVKAGFRLNLLGVVLITLVTYTLVPLIFV